VVIWFGNSFENQRPDPQGGATPTPQGAVDIMGPLGAEILLTSRQRVIEYWWYRRPIRGVTRADADRQLPDGTDNPEFSANGGNSVRTIDSEGFIHYYGHMRDTPRVIPGQTYNAGELVGYLGSTGRSWSGHLHYQVKAPMHLRPGLRRTPEDRRRYGCIPAGLVFYPFRYDGLGGRSVNPYEELCRLATSLGARRHPRNPQRYLLPPP